MTGILDVGHVGRGEEEEFGSSGGKTRGGGRGGGEGSWLVRARPRRRLARNYAYFVFEYNLLSFERGPRLFATFARFFSLAFPLHSLPPPPRFYLLFRDTRPVVKLIDPLWLRCRVHATTNSRTRHSRLGPREFCGKEMNELASSLTRERGVGVFEGRSDCG